LPALLALNQAEEQAVEADRRRHLSCWKRKEQEPEREHDVPYTLKFLERLGLK
jgi:hypothetical protein